MLPRRECDRTLTPAERADRVAYEQGFMARGPVARAIEREIMDALADAAVAALGAVHTQGRDKSPEYLAGRSHAWKDVLQLRSSTPENGRRTDKQIKENRDDAGKAP